jgi:hypothetical protein
VSLKSDNNKGYFTGARGGAVVEELRYKPEGRGIDLHGVIILPAALCTWDRLSL